jgi:hypothetical protein
MKISSEDKLIIDLEHREERRNDFDDHRKESDRLYAQKDYEKAVKWAIIAIATGVFLGTINSLTGGILKIIFSHI